ncbi:MAG: MtrB/PioB family decaheme-associated outer membrane protein, partial [Xanthomonadaceae bacterium]|nr:MtrB/PioB family decaheme-associated outer membrane protein [Xanthomonadaceae bacterium]
MKSNMFKRLSQIRTLAAACLLTAGTSGVAQSESATDEAEAAASGPDTSEWLCQNCPVFDGLTGSILFGAGYVSDDFFDFGNYRGLEEQGVFGTFGIDLLYRDADARYLGVYGEKLGLDSRTLLIEGGRQSRYDAWLEYDEIAHFRSEDTRTIFLGAGTANQELPADWVRGDTTAGMTRLDTSLRGIDIKQDRKTLRLGFSALGLSGLGFNARKEDPWRYRLEVERTKRDGHLIRGASFIFRAAELAAPIDYETTQFDAAVGFVQDRWELELAYNLSLFDNSNRSVRWQNPFLGIFDADVGELAEPPDNRFHQFMLSGSWRQSRWLALAGQVAVGRMEQDEQFLAPSLNARFSSVDLPRSALDGEVNMRIVNLRATSNLTRHLSARLRFHYDERDNDTDRDPFVQVVSDTFLTDERTNEPFSFERTSVKGELDYRFTSFLRLSASAERKKMERDFQEVRDAETDIYTAGARLN